jgi:hypothetical protein
MTRNGAEAHDDFLAIPFQRLAGAQAESGSRPAPAIELEHDLGEGLGAVLGRYSVFVDVARDVSVADPSCAVAGAMRARRDVVELERAHGAEDVDLAVAQIPFPEADRRLHRDQAEQLQEVVLDHVLERTDVVVVAGSPLEG